MPENTDKPTVGESATKGTIANLKQTSQPGEDDTAKEKAVIGTLSTVAAAAAPFAPYGTIAAAVIAAGIGVYKVFSSIEKEEIGKKLLSQSKDDLKKYKEVIDDALPRILNRPTVPIDLYSGPPMYWIVTEDDMPVVSVGDEKGNDGYFLPTGNKEVKWPCAWQGGNSLYHKNNITEANATNVSADVDLRYVYQPLAPEKTSKPAICVFFWAVPIFFARLQQKFFESLFPGASNPKEYADDKYSIYKGSKKVKRTKDEVCSDLMKEVFGKGCLDQAGNWFGKIGWVIPALATGNDEYAERYYGRTLWAHYLALQNIKYSDATKFADSGVPNDIEFMISKKNQEQYAYSVKELYGKNRRINVKSGGGTRGSQNTITPDAGWVLDLHTFLSRYHVKNPIFDKARNGDTTVLNSNNLFYLTRQYAQQYNIPSGDNSPRTVTSFSTTIESAGGSLTFQQQYYKTYYNANNTININGFNYDRFSISNVLNGSFALAPYMMFVKGSLRQVGDTTKVRPEISKDTAFSTYGFFDFDPNEFTNKSIPGLTDADKHVEWKKKYDWTRKLSVFPAVDPSIAGPDGFNNSFVNHWSYNWGTSSQETKESSFYYKTFDYSFLTINGVTPDVYEIVKDRPPIQGEETVLLKEQYWGNAKWAYDLAKNNPILKSSGTYFAIVRPQETGAPGDKLLICQISRIPMNAFAGDSVKPDAGFYYRTNLEENKPIISTGIRENDPSPFYCGRRADNRLQPLFKHIRDSVVNKGEKSQDTGWEDCHQWSWPYPSKTLNEIGRVSKKLYVEFGEGIGRSGCSPSAIATGPTFWGDVRLYEKVYPIINTGTSTEVGTQGFEVLKTQLIWDTILEMQTGAYTRYSSMANSVGGTLASAIESQFAAFSKNALGFYKSDIAAKCKQYNVVPKVYDSTTKTWKELTVDQAANLATNVMNAWFNGVFPKPKQSYQDAFSVKSAFSFDLCERVARNHIMLKKWAINLGKKKENQDPNIKFPSNDFDINTFGLNKANQDAINSYNDALSAKIEGKNPAQVIISLFKNEKPDVNQKLTTEKSIKTEHIVGGLAAAAITTAIIAAIVKRK